MNRVPAETIQEVIYQYKRYMPLNGWGDPCLLGDPPEWSNASGSKEITKSSVHLPSEAWEWVGDWTVDKSGAKQSHVDKNGWEYAATFSDFTSTNKRRGEAQTMDYARRRRWVRNRVPVSNSDDPSLRQMALFWDVLVLDDGSQVITLRSCLQIQNSLPYAVMLQLSSNSWKEMVNLGPLLPDGVLSVPLLFASAEYVRFNGADVPTDWTPPLACGIRSLDYEIQAEIACTGEID
ncbi:TECPR1, partial [Symbiodinium microadriaticum]